MAETGAAHVGCSGWMYDDWRGPVYPPDLPRNQWLPWYARSLSAVELNGTFYRLPDAASVERWRDSVPEDFTFSVKMGSFGSHRKKLMDTATWLPRHVERFTALGSRLGPTLVQLPPRWKRNTARLDEFLSLAPPTMRWAVEFRDPSWLHDDVFEVLRRHRAALCLHDLLPDHPTLVTTDWTYLRFHGPHALQRAYHGSYGVERLRETAHWVNGRLEAGHDAYLAFNNDHSGHAFHDAVFMRSQLVR